MASSSVSQESLDIEDYELSARKSRVRALRAQRVLYPRGGERETDGTGDVKDVNGDEGTGVSPEPLVHDSPTRSTAAQRAKDKRARQKGKLPKDKRKLREKRRSTGVVHLASAESTGDSLDEEDDGEEKCLTEAKKNTAYNEVIDADNPQTPSEITQRIRQFQNITVSSGTNSSVQNMAPRGYRNRRNKSPSDLDADLEDNQDYDSTFSQSDTNLTLIDQSETKDTEHAPRVPPRTYNQSKFISDSSKSFRPVVTNFESKQTQDTVPQLYSVRPPFHSKSHSDSVSRNVDSYQAAPKSPKSRLSSSSSNQSTDLVKEPVRPVSSVLARYQQQERERQEDAQSTGYKSRFSNRDYAGVRGPIGQQFATSILNRDSKDDEKRKLEKELEREKEENRRLQKLIEERDRRIAELEKDMTLMNKDLEDFEEENQKLHIENQALIRAVGQLSTEGITDV